MHNITVENFIMQEKQLVEKVVNSREENFEFLVCAGINLMAHFKSDGKSYFFKLNGSHDDFSDFGEVLSSFIFKTLGVNCVDAHFCNDILFLNQSPYFCGTLMKDFKKNTSEYVSLSNITNHYKQDGMICDYGFFEYLNFVKKFCVDNNILLDKNFESEFKALVILDFLLIQRDRHFANVEFEIYKNKNNKKILRLAPLFDNECCMFVDVSQNYLKKIENQNYYSHTKLMFAFDYRYQNNLAIMAKEIINSKFLQNLIVNFCSLDLKQILNSANELCYSITNRKLSESRINIMTNCVENRKNELLQEINLQRLQKIIESENLD